MIRDARELPGRASLEADLCIAGAGAAGITVAREFVSTGADVILLEAGPLGVDEGSAGDAPETTPYEGHASGLPIDVAGSRVRAFGGSTNRWGGWCVPMEAPDFSTDGYPPRHGWPIDRSDLRPHYEAAHETCSLGQFDYDPPASDATARLSLDGADTHLRDVLYRQSPVTDFGDGPATDLGDKYRDEFATADGVTLYTHATVVDIEADREGRRVSRFRCKAPGGTTFSVRATRFVLSMGGLENPRLLLSSGRKLGTDSDLVGRYFMQHPHCYTDTYVVLEEAYERFYSWHSPDSDAERGDGRGDERLLGAIALDAGLRDESNLPNVACTLEPVRDGGFVSKMPNNGAALGFSRIPEAHVDAVDGYLSDGSNVYRLYLRGEQRPVEESRVTLRDETDGFGVPRLEVDWRIDERDLRAYGAFLDALEREFEAADIEGEILRPNRDAGFTLRDVWGAGHHMGTTRMSRDPDRGVVTPECRVHGVDNLYVGGSSVFPTVGYANPTLTIIALAHRLADHLSRDLAAGA